MKTSDSDRKVNRNIYPDAVNVIRSVVTSRGAKGGSAPLLKLSIILGAQPPSQTVVSILLFKAH